MSLALWIFPSTPLARLVSVNVGRPRELGLVRGKAVRSGIYKEPINGPVKVGRLNLEGDEQADLTVHGGVNKAVYAYSSEHYSYWKGRFSAMNMPWGTFGENFTTEGLFEDSVRVADRLKVGSAEFEVTQPRLPCYKLGMRFGTNRILRLFLESGRTGFYLRVVKEGECKSEDDISVVPYGRPSRTIASIVNSYRNSKGEPSPATY
jgi:MOSC domain-containing protein YiiM